jgi:hypothetical protein
MEKQGIAVTMAKGKLEAVWTASEKLSKMAANNLVDSIKAIIELAKAHPELAGDIDYLLDQARK